MILAAGFGKRMMELTHQKPKPLLEIAGQSLIEHHLQNLAEAGFSDVVINVAYLAEQIINALGDGSHFGLNIQYSIEKDGPIGTAGGIMKALPYLGDQPFALISADIWSDYSFAQLPHELQAQDAHLLLVDNPSYNIAGDFGLSDNGLLNEHAPKYTYANIAVMHPRFFSDLPANTHALGPLLFSAMHQGRLTGEIYHGEWFNVGTPQELERVKQQCKI